MMLKIDERYFTKAEARKTMTAIGLFLFYTGASCPYLDYQVWMAYFRWWHPFSWLIMLIGLFIEGFNRESFSEIKDFFTRPDDYSERSYKKAR